MTRTRRSASAIRPDTGGCAVTVCLGCCCGRPAKNPAVGHQGQLDQLRQALNPTTAEVRLTDCLGICEQSNVLIVQPSAKGPAAGGRPVWLGLVHGLDAITDIATWIKEGGPGLADPPIARDLYEFTPSRRIRNNTDLE